MRDINEDTITQAVIARHAGAADARLRELMTSLVQHLHAFAREVKLTDAEWLAGIRFLAEAGQRCGGSGRELVLLSDTLGLSSLVGALNHRVPPGCTEPSLAGSFEAAGDPAAAASHPGADRAVDAAPAAPCFVRGRVRALDGAAVAGARVRVAPAAAGARGDDGIVHTDADGRFELRCATAGATAIPHDGPVGRMLRALGREPWRPAHLRFEIGAAGFAPLVTQIYRADGAYLDADAAFGVRRSLVADWVRQEPGRTPDGQTCDVPFYTLDYEFVLHRR